MIVHNNEIRDRVKILDPLLSRSLDSREQAHVLERHRRVTRQRFKQLALNRRKFPPKIHQAQHTEQLAFALRQAHQNQIAPSQRFGKFAAKHHRAGSKTQRRRRNARLLAKRGGQPVLNHLFPALRGPGQCRYFPFGAAAKHQDNRARSEHFCGARRKPAGKFRRAKRRIQLERGGGELGQQALKRAVEARRDFPDSLQCTHRRL